MPESQSCYNDIRNLLSLEKRCTILVFKERFVFGSSLVWEKWIISLASSVTAIPLSVLGVILMRNLLPSCLEREA